MLKIHKPNHKLLIISITSILSIGTLLGFSALTYTPELSHAEVIDTIDRRTIDDITYMQEITPEICQNSELDKQYTLTDIRDDNTYTVARIKNSTNDETNCWMTQNLRIIDKEISYLDSDLESGSFTVPASATTLNDFNADHQYEPMAYYYYANLYYYNWHTATAGTSSLVDKNSNDTYAVGSICPKNWRLPTIIQFKTLATDLSYPVIMYNPYRFTFTGSIRTDYLGKGELLYADSDGIYWSSSDNAYSLRFTKNSASIMFEADSKYYGHSMRCVARTKTNSNNIEITVNPTISLDVTNEVEIEKDNNGLSTSNMDVIIASNQPYSVSISSANPNLTSTNGTTIPSKSGLLNTNENGWGIKLNSNSTYSQITSTPATFYTATGAEVKTIPFTIGISTSPDLPNGEYSTDITITATQN